jgi:hypothetical protein
MKKKWQNCEEKQGSNYHVINTSYLLGWSRVLASEVRGFWSASGALALDMAGAVAGKWMGAHIIIIH